MNKIIESLQINKKFRNPVSVSLKYLGELDFDIKLSNGQSLQRPIVWSEFQKAQFIISLLKNIYIPPLYIIKKEMTSLREPYIERVIDGKQRLTSYISYLNNEFPIEVSGVKYYFKDLDEYSQDYLKRYDFNVAYFYEYYESPLSDIDLINMFEFLNFSGTPQDYNHISNLKNSIANG